MQLSLTNRARVNVLIIASLVCASTGAVHATLQETQPQRLNPGQRVERAISGSEPHTYVIYLPAGKFLQILVENTSPPVAKNPVRFNLKSSDGVVLAKGDEISIIKGHGRISWVGERDAEYQLEVRRDEQRYWTADPQASYVIRVLELRDDTPTDSNIVAGERAIREDRYSDAVNDFRIAGDLPGLAESLEQLGSLAARLEAVDIARRLGDLNRVASNLLAIGGYYGNLGDWQNALNYIHQSLAVAQDSHDLSGQGLARGDMGRIYLQLGDPLTALDLIQQSLELIKSDGTLPAPVTGALDSLGKAYVALGDLGKSLDYKRQTVEWVHSNGNRNMEAYYRNDLAMAYVSSGQYGPALDQLAVAMDLYRHDNQGAGQMRTLISTGKAYVASRDAAKAQGAFMRAMEIEKTYTFPDGPELAAPMRIGMGEVLLLTGNRQGALDYFKRALEICRQLHDWRGEAEALRRIAELESTMGSLQDSRSHIQLAIEIIESVRGRVAGGNFQSTYSATKRQFYEAYLDILVRSQATVEALEASERFRMRGFVEMLNEARVDIRQGVEPALISQEQALARQINNQQQTLMRMLGDSSKVTAARDAETRLNDLFLKYQETEGNIRARSPAYAALIHPTSLTLTQIQSLIDPGSMVLEYWLGEKTSYVWAIARDSIAVYALPERARVEREVERFYKLLTARQAKSGEKPADHLLRVRNADAQYRESATSLSRMLLAPVMPQIGTKRLLIVADGALHYIPFAALPTPGGAPNPSAQCQGKCLLLDQHEIVSLPSVSVLAALRERKSAPTSLRQTVAVYADPVFDKSDPRVRQQAAAIAPILPAPRHLEREMIDAGLGARLPRLVASRLEAQGIESAASSGQSRLFLDFFASRDQVLMSPLNDYRILHFATHGFIDNTHPELSGLVLSLVDAAGSPQDGFLRLHEIYNLRLNADLVVLSACNTALGKNISGEGLIGLTRGFMYAGARRVMATLWKVDDEAAAEEMRKLYQHLLARGEAPAAALRAAQLEMLNSPQWQAPYYWSAFTLQGD